MTNSRRDILVLSALGVGSFLTGCSGLPSNDTPNDTNATTRDGDNSTERTPQTKSLTTTSTEHENTTVTETRGPATDLNLSAEVLRQQSTSTPASVRVILSNSGRLPVDVRYGPTLLYTGSTAGTEWSDDLILDPETYIGPWDDPVQGEEGCWRFPEDGSINWQSSVETRVLSPDETIQEEYKIYTYGSEGECLPAGTHIFEDQLRTDSGETIFSLTLEIGQDNEISASAEIEFP